MNIDTLLTSIINHNVDQLIELIPPRDYRVFHSLARSILSPSYITERQSNLLIKLIKNNIDQLKLIDPLIETYIVNPLWSKPFRFVDHTKKMYIKQISEHNCIQFEFVFSGQLKKVFLNLQKKVPDLSLIQSGKLYAADLNEKNIVLFVEELTPYGFEIDKKIKEYYDIIKTWDWEEYKNQFLISTIQYPNFQKQLTADLGIDTPLSQNIILDRSNRYQYFVEKLENPQTLSEHIANRSGSHIWIDSNKYSLEEVISSLIELKRLPIMFVFENIEPKRCTNDLKRISQALDYNNITDNIGIYFRLPNENGKCEFNQLIADRGYNSQLTHNTTKVVGIQSGKIPKFFLKSDWKPMSVITINNSLKHTKTSVYANCCDLIITYTTEKPLIEAKMTWR